MRITGLGQVLFALGFAALGGLIIAWPDMGLLWQTVPKAFPWHDTLTTVSGVVLLAGGAALLVPPTARPASLVLAVFLLIRLVRIKLFILARQPLVEVAWEDMSESLVHVAGAWTIFSLLSREGGALARFANVRAGQILFALAMPALGLSHFFYLNQTAPLIPSWIPFHVTLSYFTGAAHIAAGFGILFGGLLFAGLPRLAATLEAVMTSLFTIIVWIPMLVAAPASHSSWREFCVSTTIAGAAWVVAESFRGRPRGVG